ncbi:MAG: hypothetical protein NZ959_02975 [Armatimonadetes bacterium]|nr:hypothetical protein [Armatimonadota bacterium]MDW8121586.1 hypothetical protein [Armatimonadota bacterium]
MRRDIYAEKLLSVQVRRELMRSGLDISRAEVVSSGGVVSLYGVIARARGDYSGESLESKLQRALERVRRLPGVRDVVIHARMREG